MSKIVKIKQKDIESIVKNVIKENEELDEIGMGQKQFKVYAAKDDEGNYYIIDAESGKILAKDNPTGEVEDLPMAAE